MDGTYMRFFCCGRDAHYTIITFFQLWNLLCCLEHPWWRQTHDLGSYIGSATSDLFHSAPISSGIIGIIRAPMPLSCCETSVIQACKERVSN